MEQVSNIAEGLFEVVTIGVDMYISLLRNILYNYGYGIITFMVSFFVSGYIIQRIMVEKMLRRKIEDMRLDIDQLRYELAGVIIDQNILNSQYNQHYQNTQYNQHINQSSNQDRSEYQSIYPSAPSFEE